MKGLYNNGNIIKKWKKVACVRCSGTGKKNSGHTCLSCNGNGTVRKAVKE